MPICKERRLLYPPNWRELRAAVQARAGDRCETCGVPNHAVGVTKADGVFCEVTNSEFFEGIKLFMIVCTTAHIHEDDEGTTDIRRLVFECQRCHLRRDAVNHRRNSLETRKKKRGLLSLF